MNKVKKAFLKVGNVSKSFDKKKIFEGITFNVYTNEVLGVLAYSGEGKSSLLNMICGIESIDYGNISYFHHDMYVNINAVSNSFVKDLVGYSTQEPSFYEEFTIAENLDFYGTLLDVDSFDRKKKAKELMEIFNLKGFKKEPAKNLSVGQKKRLDLACALIHSPKLLILDEPTANLDFLLRGEIISYIKKIHKLGVTIIYVSHFLEEIEELSNRVLLINKCRFKIVKPRDLKKKFMEFVEVK